MVSSSRPYSVQPFEVWVSGAPQAQPRPRAKVLMLPQKGSQPCPACGQRKASPRVQMYANPRGAITQWKNTIGDTVAKAVETTEWGEDKSSWFAWHRDVPLRVSLEFVMPRPKVHWAANGKDVKPSYRDASHSVKPDADNLAKAVLDVLEGILFEADQQVIRLDVLKRYETEPGQHGVRIQVRPYIHKKTQ